PTPSITRVSPRAGPPTTLVTIEGTQFDSSVQNIDVTFSGVSARIVSASPSQIVAVVPYGATSGPMSLSVFCVAAIGSVDFSFTSTITSLNRASYAYAVVDSTPQKGGTNLSFQWGSLNDDGLATAQLPFTFSLFKDIYLPGSNITISSNGWMSLEVVSDPYT